MTNIHTCECATYKHVDIITNISTTRSTWSTEGKCYESDEDFLHCTAIVYLHQTDSQTEKLKCCKNPPCDLGKDNDDGVYFAGLGGKPSGCPWYQKWNGSKCDWK